jgi:hypothetical protein
MNEPLKVFIGFDSREPEAYEVAVSSLMRRASVPVSVTPLEINRLAAHGLLRRPTDLRGQRYDLPSNAPASTEFAVSRFLVPLLAQTGFALFCDSDVVFLDDVANLFALAEEQYAVMCVKHSPQTDVAPKMDSQAQVSYPFKNWSSVMLWNCEHPANRRLSLVDINERPGRDLHGMYWCNPIEIGALPARWNYLVGVHERPKNIGLAHFTLGIPTLCQKELPEHQLWYQELQWLKNHPSEVEPASNHSNTNSRAAAA